MDFSSSVEAGYACRGPGLSLEVSRSAGLGELSRNLLTHQHPSASHAGIHWATVRTPEEENWGSFSSVP